MTNVDMHLHLRGRSPCSSLELRDLEIALSPAISVVCVTDHDTNAPLRQNGDLTQGIVIGAEVECLLEGKFQGCGHVLVFGVELLPPRHSYLAEALNFVHRQGGICIAAHPFGKNGCALEDEVFEFPFDAIELNGRLHKKENALAKQAAEVLDLPTIGGSDAHHITQLNTLITIFQQPVHSGSELVAAVKRKQCKAGHTPQV